MRRKGLPDKSNIAGKVSADTAYRSQENEKFLDDNGSVSYDSCKNVKGKTMSEATRRANNLKSKVRSHAEHIFAEQKSQTSLLIRTIGIARATTKIGLTNLLYNVKRPIGPERTVVAEMWRPFR